MRNPAAPTRSSATKTAETNRRLLREAFGGKQKQRICPKCGRTYTERPALSRSDNRTLICPDCGTREALESMGISTEEQDKILGIIHDKYDGE